MFDQFKAMGQIAGLLKNKDRLADAAERVKAELEAVEVEGQAGGGAVRVRASGKLRILSVTVETAAAAGLATPEHKADAEQLITEATNDALTKAQEAARVIVEREMQELGLPALPADLGNFLP